MTVFDNASTGDNNYDDTERAAAAGRLHDLAAGSSLLSGGRFASFGGVNKGRYDDDGEDIYETISSLHSNPSLLPSDHIRSSLIRIGCIVIVITTFYLVVVQLLRLRSARYSRREEAAEEKEGRSTQSKQSPAAAKAASSPKSAEKAAAEAACVWKTSYQITNLLINLTLGLLGLYHQLHTIPSQLDSTPTSRVEGYESLSIFAEIQIAYQAWALPVGYFLVNEQSSMLIHHGCVVIVASMSAFFTNGFRYYNPFFYGLIEISSVPLAVMNAFKANAAWRERYPVLNTVIRLIFCFMFLVVRFVLWMPNIYDYLRLCGLLAVTCEGYKCTAGFGASWAAGFGLTVLQLIWARKIVKGIGKALLGGGGKVKKTTKVA